MKKDLTKYQLNRNIICIDLKSFYASVECVLRKLDPFTTSLAVADSSVGDNAVILAVTPYLKSLGINSRGRIFQIPKEYDVIYARPRMKTYLDYSISVIKVLLEFFSLDDIYPYSIDESFIDVTSYLKLYNKTDINLAKQILQKIKEKTGLHAVIGIGPNMLLAKVAMDVEAKKNANFIAKWTYDDLEKLWQISPLSKMWGIGSRMEKRLNLLGITSVKELANYSLTTLKRKFGIIGEELWYHANGIDMSLIQDKHLLRGNSKSYGTSQVLKRTYNDKEIMTIILEMIDELTNRLRVAKKAAKQISLSILYDKGFEEGFSKQTTLEQATSSATLLYEACMIVFDTNYEQKPIKRVGIYLSKLENNNMYQYSLFEDSEALDKEQRLSLSIDKIKNKYGKNKVGRLSSLQDHSTAKDRNEKLGGHHV